MSEFGWMKKVILRHFGLISGLVLLCALLSAGQVWAYGDIDPNGTYIDAVNSTATIGGTTGTFSTQTPLGSLGGNGYLLAGGTATAGNCPPAAGNEGREYEVNFPTAGTYDFYVKNYGLDGGTDSVYIGLDGSCVGGLNNAGTYNTWTWSNSVQTGANQIIVPNDGQPHTLNIWVRETGHAVDVVYVVLASVGTAPSDAGYSSGFVLDPTVLPCTTNTGAVSVTGAARNGDPIDVC